MTSRSVQTAALLAAVAMVVLSACQKSTVSQEPATMPAPPSTSAAPAAPASPAPTSATITIDGFEYSNVTVAPGAQITVQNNDLADHTVTSNTGAFDVPVSAKSKATFTAPMQPGSYPFHCTYHASMHGTLTVQ